MCSQWTHPALSSYHATSAGRWDHVTDGLPRTPKDVEILACSTKRPRLFQDFFVQKMSKSTMFKELSNSYVSLYIYACMYIYIVFSSLRFSYFPWHPLPFGSWKTALNPVKIFRKHPKYMNWKSKTSNKKITVSSSSLNSKVWTTESVKSLQEYRLRSSILNKGW